LTLKMDLAAMTPGTSLDAVGIGAGIGTGAGRRFLGLDPSRMLSTASRRTGLGDFGDPEFRNPFERLVRSVEFEAA